MIHPYNSYYLEMAQDKLGNMFDIACLYEGLNIDEFSKSFAASPICYAFETADPVFIAGKSAAELLAIVLDKDPLSIEQNDYSSPEYWTGYVYAGAQWAFNIGYKSLFDAIKPSELILSYFPYHEMPLESALEFVKSKITQENKLKKKRIESGLSQTQLAYSSEIPIRTIKAYEQGKLDLNKASLENIVSLARALHCKVEEFI